MTGYVFWEGGCTSVLFFLKRCRPVFFLLLPVNEYIFAQYILINVYLSMYCLFFPLFFVRVRVYAPLCLCACVLACAHVHTHSSVLDIIIIIIIIIIINELCILSLSPPKDTFKKNKKNMTQLLLPCHNNVATYNLLYTLSFFFALPNMLFVS